MGFRIEPDVFNVLPTLCIGVVVADGIDNTGTKGTAESVTRLRQEAVLQVNAKFRGTDLKTHPDIACYREAFRKLGYNPNKFPSSIEALTSRVLKGHPLPYINPIVNLVNAVSLKHSVPMGAHDLEAIGGSVSVRFSRSGKMFTPLGEVTAEEVPEGELVYAAGDEIRTRRWIWRQNDKGKVTESSSHIFFPIDGFTDINRAAVESAMDELAEHLKTLFGVETLRGVVDRDKMEMQF